MMLHRAPAPDRRQSGAGGFSLDKLDAFASQGFNKQQVSQGQPGSGGQQQQQPAYSNVPLSQIPTKRECNVQSLCTAYSSESPLRMTGM